MRSDISAICTSGEPVSPSCVWNLPIVLFLCAVARLISNPLFSARFSIVLGGISLRIHDSCQRKYSRKSQTSLRELGHGQEAAVPAQKTRIAGLGAQAVRNR